MKLSDDLRATQELRDSQLSGDLRMRYEIRPKELENVFKFHCQTNSLLNGPLARFQLLSVLKCIRLKHKLHIL